jgi:hypothetical protein
MYKDMLDRVSVVIKQLNKLEDELEVFDDTDKVELYQFVIRSNTWLTYAQDRLQEVVNEEQQNV